MKWVTDEKTVTFSCAVAFIIVSFIGFHSIVLDTLRVSLVK